MALTTEPSGCRWCGDIEGHHGWQWTTPAGMHQWEEPTDAQRLARMRLRRSRRDNDPTHSP